MATPRTARSIRPVDVFGLASVGLALLLSSGVSTVRADEGDPSVDDDASMRMSVDPALLEAAKRAGAAHRARVPAPAPAGQPTGMVQLNTRGFNYGPGPQGIEQGAMRFESGPAAPAPEPR